MPNPIAIKNKAINAKKQPIPSNKLGLIISLSFLSHVVL
jgi:hypothetical protein